MFCTLLTCTLVHVPLQLRLHHLIIDLEEVILLEGVFNLSLQALLHVCKLLVKVIKLFPLLLQYPLNKLMLLLDLGI